MWTPWQRDEGPAAAQAQGGCVRPQWEHTCAGMRFWGTAWIWLLKSLWMGDARLLVSSLLAALSLEILFIGYRVEQNNCCNHSLCVCVCPRLQMFLRVDLPWCICSHVHCVCSHVLFWVKVCVWSHLLLSLTCAQTMTPNELGKKNAKSLLLNSSTMTLLWSCSAGAIDEQVAVWIICFWFGWEHSEHCVILKTLPNCCHLDSSSHGIFSRNA